MKNQLKIAMVVSALMFAGPVIGSGSATGSAHAAETKKVCVKEFDNKTKKEKEVCKTIKVHKKLEGTKIEDVKKDSKK